ncbi:MAG TPA: hypothetical protein VK140_01825 [Ktedonobacteraceae bacterium]|nr:hypothetical protein [Ktedonobacteraceae bacterium]
MLPLLSLPLTGAPAQPGRGQAIVIAGTAPVTGINRRTCTPGRGQAIAPTMDALDRLTIIARALLHFCPYSHNISNTISHRTQQANQVPV